MPDQTINIPCDCPNNDCVPCSRDKNCPITLDASCVFYHIDGDDDLPSQLTCLNLPNHTSAQDIFERLDDIVCNVSNIPISVLETFTAKMTATGPANHTLKTDVKVSDDNGNVIEIRPDGLFVPDNNATTPLVANDSSTIDFTTSGTEGHTLTGVVKFSTTSGNITTSNGTGVYTPLQTLQVVTDAGHTSTRTDVQLGGLGIGGAPSNLLDIFGPVDDTTTFGGKFSFNGTNIVLRDTAKNPNLLIGFSSGTNLSESSDNIGFGAFALNLITGDDNIGIGRSVMSSAGDISRNTVIGKGAFSLSNGNDNVAIGYLAGAAVFGDSNISIGSNTNTAAAIAAITVDNSEIVLNTSRISGADIASLITTYSLTTGTRYAMSLSFTGTPPAPVDSDNPFVYANATVINSNTLEFDRSPFTTQGTGTFVLTYYNQQDNSIAIGFNMGTASSNQIRIGNSSHTLFSLNNFTVNLTVAPANSYMGTLIHDGTNYKYQRYTMTTTQRNALVPYEGQEIYNLTTHKNQTWDGTTWQDHW